MERTRREFLGEAARLGAFLPVSWALSPYLARALGASNSLPAAKDKVLVLVQLVGGNDGLNTLVPWADEEYYKARPVLAVRREAVLRLDDDAALHPAMKPMHKLFEDGALAVVQGVGYPHPNRSHFRSTDIWESGIPERVETRTGWVGRALDRRKIPDDALPCLCAGGADLPLTLIGERTRAIAVSTIDSLRFRLGGEEGETLDSLAALPAEKDSDLEYLRATTRLALRSAKRLERMEDLSRGGSELELKLQLVARLIEADLGTRMFLVKLGGFDTHANQAKGHAELLRQLSEALASFHAKLRGMGQENRVLTMTFSEFGRRLAENRSYGTDHGAAAPLFLLGGGVRSGIHGARPSLDDLDDGDPKFTVDFRAVHAAVLEDFFGWGAKGGAQVPKIAGLFG